MWPPRFPSKEVGVDQSKLIKEEDYEAFIAERPSLKRRPAPKPEVILQVEAV